MRAGGDEPRRYTLVGGRRKLAPMRVSKYIHSCLLIESDGDRLLIDPGKFSFSDGRVTLGIEYASADEPGASVTV